MTSQNRLGAAINERRLELGLRWVEITNAAKITDSALRAMRRGDYPPSDLTAHRLEDALQWEHGSINAILEGGKPTPAQEKPPGPDNTVQWAEDIEGHLVSQGFSAELSRVAARSAVDKLTRMIDDLPAEHEQRKQQERAQRQPRGA